MTRWLPLLALLPVLALPAAADEPVLVPADAAWGLVFDARQFHQTALVDSAWQHLGEARQQKALDRIDGLSNILGLDLRGELGRVVAFGHGYAPKDMALAVELGPDQTNLEGLLLAGHDYQSFEHGDTLIHSVKQEPQLPRVYCAVLPASAGRPGLMIASPGKELTTRLVDQADAGAAVASPARLHGHEFLRLWITSVPREMLAPGTRQSNIAAMIQSIELIGTGSDDRGTLSLNLHMVNEDRARMLMQMASGFKAMVQFAAEEDLDAAKLADLLAYVSIDQPDRGSVVRLQADLTRQDLAGLLDLLERAGALDELDLD
jgi:hypothetical protein